MKKKWVLAVRTLHDCGCVRDVAGSRFVCAAAERFCFRKRERNLATLSSKGNGNARETTAAWHHHNHHASRTRRGRDHRPALLDGWVIRFGLPAAFIRFRRPRANISSAIRGLQTTASAYHPLHHMAHRCRQEAVVAGAAVYLVHHDAHHCKRRPRNCRSGPEY